MAQTLGDLRDFAKQNNTSKAFREAMQKNNHTYEALREIIQNNPIRSESFSKLMQQATTYTSLYNQIQPALETTIIMKPQLLDITKIQNAISPLTDFRFNTRINDILKQTKYQYDFTKFNNTLNNEDFKKQLKNISTFNNTNIDLAIKQMQRVIGEMQQETTATEESVPTKDNEFIYILFEYIFKCYDTAQVIIDINNSNVSFESFLITMLFVIKMALPYAKKHNEKNNKKG